MKTCKPIEAVNITNNIYITLPSTILPMMLCLTHTKLIKSVKIMCVSAYLRSDKQQVINILQWPNNAVSVIEIVVKVNRVIDYKSNGLLRHEILILLDDG